MQEKVSVVTLVDTPEDATVPEIDGIVGTGHLNNRNEFIDKALHGHLGVRVESCDGHSQYDAPQIDGRVYIPGCRMENGEFHKAGVAHACDYGLSGVGIA